MMKTGKTKLYMSVGLAILLILQGALLVILKPEAGSSVWFIFGVIIILAVAAIAFSYRGINKIKNRMENLPEDYQRTYIDAQEVIGLSSMTLAMKKETDQLIMEIFEHAALDDRDVDEVINHDLKKFIEPFLEAGGGATSFLYLLSYSSFLFVMYLLMMKLYKVIRVGITAEAFKTEHLDFGITFVYAIIAFIFFPWMTVVMKKASKEQWTGIKRLYIILPFIIPFGLMGMLILVRIPELTKILDIEVPIFSSVSHFLMGVIVMLCALVMMKLGQKQQLKKSLKE